MGNPSVRTPVVPNTPSRDLLLAIVTLCLSAVLFAMFVWIFTVLGQAGHGPPGAAPGLPSGTVVQASTRTPTPRPTATLYTRPAHPASPSLIPLPTLVVILRLSPIVGVPTMTATRTRSATPDWTVTRTRTRTPTRTRSPGFTKTQTASATLPAPLSTLTGTPTLTATLTETATLSATITPTGTVAITPTSTSTAVSACVSSATPGLAASDDTWIEAANPATTHGGDASLPTRTNAGADQRVLINFSLAALRGSSVESARLYIFVQSADPGITLQVYRLTRDWTETQATWDEALSAQPWGLPGGDLNAVPVIRFEPAGTGCFVPLDVGALVQGWFDGAIPNHGLILIASGPGSLQATFSAKENTDGHGPVLSVVMNP